jgi:hypothetical protein
VQQLIDKQLAASKIGSCIERVGPGRCFLEVNIRTRMQINLNAEDHNALQNQVEQSMLAVTY